MREFKNFIVGINENQEIVTITHVKLDDNCTFTVGFGTWRIVPFNEDVCRYRAESYIDCNSKEWLFDKCDYYDCKPSELLEHIACDLTEDEVFDFNPTYSNEFQDEDGNDVYLDFCGSSPQNYKGSPIIKFVNEDIEKLFIEVNEFGRCYHLEKVPSDIGNKILNKFDCYEDKDTFDEDIQFIKDNMN